VYEGVIFSVRTNGGITSAFLITIGSHQGVALSPYLITLVLDGLTSSTRDEIQWCMLFADNIVSVDETRGELTL
jgi:hypothetical protein